MFIACPGAFMRKRLPWVGAFVLSVLLVLILGGVLFRTFTNRANFAIAGEREEIIVSRGAMERTDVPKYHAYLFKLPDLKMIADGPTNLNAIVRVAKKGDRFELVADGAHETKYGSYSMTPQFSFVKSNAPGGDLSARLKYDTIKIFDQEKLLAEVDSPWLQSWSIESYFFNAGKSVVLWQSHSGAPSDVYVVEDIAQPKIHKIENLTLLDTVRPFGDPSAEFFFVPHGGYDYDYKSLVRVDPLRNKVQEKFADLSKGTKKFHFDFRSNKVIVLDEMGSSFLIDGNTGKPIALKLSKEDFDSGIAAFGELGDKRIAVIGREVLDLNDGKSVQTLSNYLREGRAFLSGTSLVYLGPGQRLVCYDLSKNRVLSQTALTNPCTNFSNLTVSRVLPMPEQSALVLAECFPRNGSIMLDDHEHRFISATEAKARARARASKEQPEILAAVERARKSGNRDRRASALKYLVANYQTLGDEKNAEQVLHELDGIQRQTP
jgi:hypothetical protein